LRSEADAKSRDLLFLASDITFAVAIFSTTLIIPNQRQTCHSEPAPDLSFRTGEAGKEPALRVRQQPTVLNLLGSRSRGRAALQRRVNPNKK